jgi:hypothetical protein
VDLNVTAFRVVQSLTSEKAVDKRTAAARVAGKRGGPARALSLTKEERQAIAVKANRARWEKASSR